MVLQQLNDYYNNWLNKADNYNSNTLSNQFDKFTSLYVLFNSLYMQVMTNLVLAGHHIPTGFKDKIAATDYVIQYLGSTYYLNNLLNDEQSKADLNSICDIIEQEEFHIILDWGNQQRQKDIALLNSLRSTSSQRKAIAILSLFYHIRCNMFHGHKDYVDRQRALLEPVNNLLRKTVVLTFNKLNE
jgi:hypothetical protein